MELHPSISIEYFSLIHPCMQANVSAILDMPPTYKVHPSKHVRESSDTTACPSKHFSVLSSHTQYHLNPSANPSRDPMSADSPPSTTPPVPSKIPPFPP